MNAALVLPQVVGDKFDAFHTLLTITEQYGAEDMVGVPELACQVPCILVYVLPVAGIDTVHELPPLLSEEIPLPLESAKSNP